MNAPEVQISIDDTILILSRAMQDRGGKLSDITLVGGQALNFWADQYFGNREDFVSGDIDLLGGTTEALRCAKAWNAKIQVADLDSGMGSPNTAVVMIDRGIGLDAMRVDFLSNIIGPSVRDILKFRSEVLSKLGFSFYVMHPLHVMESRISNAFYLGRKDETAMRRLELSFSIVKAYTKDQLVQNSRKGLNIVERIVDLAFSEFGKKAWYFGHDPMTAIPIPRETTLYPILFLEERWPRIQAELADKRESYANTMQQIEQFHRQRPQQKQDVGDLNQNQSSSTNPYQNNPWLQKHNGKTDDQFEKNAPKPTKNDWNGPS
ncbi:MAG: hypothetical protein M0Z43_07010 [Acidithiobacillus sp.]|jgi:hypothetical protein|nr:hypothetical protein [Acidithiobacillus sp.]